MERFLSILIEHFAGNFPFWLSPVQVNILPIGENQHEFAKELKNLFYEAGYRVELDLRNEKINRKIAESETAKVPYALVIGQKEAESRSISLREHGKGNIGVFSIEQTLELFESLNDAVKK
jgi:threonyl-tRNA synthetase